MLCHRKSLSWTPYTWGTLINSLKRCDLQFPCLYCRCDPTGRIVTMKHVIHSQSVRYYSYFHPIFYIYLLILGRFNEKLWVTYLFHGKSGCSQRKREERTRFRTGGQLEYKILVVCVAFLPLPNHLIPKSPLCFLRGLGLL